MPRLYVLSGDDLGRTFDIAQGPAILGRIQNVDCSVRGVSVSRRHARLEHDGDGWVLVDLGSRNGIAKGGVRRERIPLEDGDVFLLGEVELRFRDDEPRNDTSAGLVADDEADDDSVDRWNLTRGVPAGVASEQARAEAADGDGDGDELELEGDWSDVAPPPPAAPLRPAASTAAPRSVAPEPPAAPGRGARQAVTRAAALGVGAARGEQATTSGRAILQYHRVEERAGFFATDLGQQPLHVRLLLTLLLLAFGAGLVYAAFQLTQSLRTDPSTVLQQDEGN